MHEAYTKNLKNILHYAVQWEDERFGWHFVSIKNLRNAKGIIAESYAVGEKVIFKTGKKEFPGKVLSKEEAPVEKKVSASKYLTSSKCFSLHNVVSIK